MRTKIPVLLVLVGLAGCSEKTLTREQYTAQWQGAMVEYERTTGALPEPEMKPEWTPEQKTTAVADALIAASGEFDRVAKQHDALKPPKDLKVLHELSSRFLREEADLFRQYSAAIRANESTDPVRAKFREHQNGLGAIRDEAEKLGAKLPDDV